MQKSYVTDYKLFTKGHVLPFLKKKNDHLQINVNLKPYNLHVKKCASDILRVAGITSCY